MRHLEALIHRETTLFDLGRLILDGASSGGDRMRAAPDLIAAGLMLDYVELFELQPSDNAVRLIGSNVQDPSAIGSVERPSPSSLLVDPRLRAHQPVIISDWQDETRLNLPVALRDVGVRSSLAIVISLGSGQRVYGFLTAHSRKPRTFSDDEILFLETVARFLACAFAEGHSARSFSALVENAIDVIVRFDSDLRIIYANPAVERVTGSAAGLFIGKTSGDLGLLEPLVPRWELLLRQVWRTGREQSYELTVATPTGERLFLSRIVPESDPRGSVRSLLTILRDVTEQRHAESERLELYQQLVTQQNRVQELMSRGSDDRAPTLQRTNLAGHLHHLTDRERRILQLLAEGWTNRQIGGAVGLSTGSVKNQVARILSKMNVTDRTQAAVRAVESGLVGHAEQQ